MRSSPSKAENDQQLLEASYQTLKAMEAQHNLRAAQDLRLAQAQATRDAARHAATEHISSRSRDYSLDKNVAMVREARSKSNKHKEKASSGGNNRAGPEDTPPNPPEGTAIPTATPVPGPLQIPLTKHVNWQPHMHQHAPVNVYGHVTFLQGQHWHPESTMNVPQLSLPTRNARLRLLTPLQGLSKPIMLFLLRMSSHVCVASFF